MKINVDQWRLVVFNTTMHCVKRSVTLPKKIDSHVAEMARAEAKRRGVRQINYSAALAEIVIEARNCRAKARKLEAA